MDKNSNNALAALMAQPASSNSLRDMGHTYLRQMSGEEPPGFATNTLMGFTASPATTRIPPGALDALRSGILARNPNLRLWIGQSPSGHLTVSNLVVPAEVRGRGVGTSVMRELTDFADAQGVPMALTPDAAFGGTVSRLREFYQRFGFRPNVGRSRDLSISESMIREAKP